MILAKEKFGPAIDKAVFPGRARRPLVHVIAAKAVCFLEALSTEFRAYQQQVVRERAGDGGSLKAKGSGLSAVERIRNVADGCFRKRA